MGFYGSSKLFYGHRPGFAELWVTFDHFGPNSGFLSGFSYRFCIFPLGGGLSEESEKNSRKKKQENPYFTLNY